MLRRLRFLQYFALTLSLWFAIRLVSYYTLTLDYPVKYAKIPGKLKLSQELPDKLTLSIRGKGQDLLFPYLGFFWDTLEVNLKTAVRKPYLETRTLNDPLKLQLPESYTILAIAPDTIVLKFEEKIAKRVPVIPRIQLKTDAGFFLSQQMTLFPDSVTLIGAETDLIAINSWPTETYTIADLHSSGSADIPLKSSADLHISESAVKASYRVERFTEVTRTLEIQLTGFSPEQRVRLLPHTVTVRYLVPLEKYDELANTRMRALVTPQDLHPDAAFVSPRIVGAIDGIQRLQTSPAYVRFVRNFSPSR